jgi:hypothetical protein
MSLLGLPGEAAVPLVVGYVINIYAAVGALQAIDLTGPQITVLAIASLIGHNLLVEGAVLRKTGMNGVAFGFLRVASGLAAAAVANLLMGLFCCGACSSSWCRSWSFSSSSRARGRSVLWYAAGRASCAVWA